MPITRSPTPPNTSGGYAPTAAVVPAPVCAGSAVCIHVDSGVRHIRLCGAVSYPQLFMGFSIGGGTGTIITGRGSVITPLVEGSVSLVQDQPVFLAMTPGYVTQTAPTTEGSCVLRVGTAISATQIVLTSDMYVRNP